MRNKQQAFIAEYLKDFNATQAAIRAGYSAKTAYSIGQENLKKPEIAKLIEENIKERIMGAEEALLLMSSHARANMGEFVKFYDGIKEPYLDLQMAQEKGLLHLVKRMSYNREGRLEIELYDAQAAIRDILKIHGKFVDKMEHTGKDGGPMQNEVILKVVFEDGINNTPEAPAPETT